MSVCGCTPGTPENGWHEERSEACLAEERAEFARALEAFAARALTPEIISRQAAARQRIHERNERLRHGEDAA